MRTKSARATTVDEFCKILLRTGSLEFGTFKLASGILSPYYVDLRFIPSNPEAFQSTVAMYASVLSPTLVKRFQRLAGVPTAGIAYAAAVALQLGKPQIYVKREHKDHNRQRRIEGFLQPGDRVAVLDDVATSGKSILEAIDAIRAEGGIVEEAVVLLDREQGAERNLKRHGIRLHSFTTMRNVTQKLLSMGTIDEKQRDEILRQIAR